MLSFKLSNFGLACQRAFMFSYSSQLTRLGWFLTQLFSVLFSEGKGLKSSRQGAAMWKGLYSREEMSEVGGDRDKNII